jgi:hypothetical protein
LKMHIEGTVRKMRTALKGEVQYFLPVGNSEIYMNELIGSEICIKHTGIINCIRCGRLTRTSFAQGYCYSCFISAPETEECVLRPELCRAHEGIARDMEYAASHCLTDHFVYLSQTPATKVGVTRSAQIPTRWIDQGADRAVILARTPNRYKAGLLEVALKNVFPDKTNWKQMLSGNVINTIDLVHEKGKAEEILPFDLRQYFTENDEIVEISYPVQSYPSGIKSINMDKSGIISGRLIGIKGQYLIFEDGLVINIRKYGGYYLEINS